jgi:adenylate cyclase class 2
MEHRNPIETEVKLRVPSLAGLQARLEVLGFLLTVPAQAETSELWDRDAELLTQGSALRLRLFAGKAWLTWKGPKIPDALLKIRPELETEIADPQVLEGILQALGFRPVLRMVKTRALMRRTDLVACLDETPFGCFLELEGEAPAIHATMAALNLGPEAAELRSYPTLFREHGLGARPSILREPR